MFARLWNHKTLLLKKLAQLSSTKFSASISVARSPSWHLKVNNRLLQSTAPLAISYESQILKPDLSQLVGSSSILRTRRFTRFRRRRASHSTSGYERQEHSWLCQVPQNRIFVVRHTLVHLHFTSSSAFVPSERSPSVGAKPFPACISLQTLRKTRPEHGTTWSHQIKAPMQHMREGPVFSRFDRFRKQVFWRAYLARSEPHPQWSKSLQKRCSDVTG